jgi:hypothetical protein
MSRISVSSSCLRLSCATDVALTVVVVAAVVIVATGSELSSFSTGVVSPVDENDGGIEDKPAGFPARRALRLSIAVTSEGVQVLVGLVPRV